MTAVIRRLRSYVWALVAVGVTVSAVSAYLYLRGQDLSHWL
jgi:NADH:ubiquinone oxidoreductase subunit 2 (subunit N)